MTKHTPGPWVFNDGATRKIIANNECILYQDSYNDLTPENIKDWQLISAAPEMLEALEIAAHVMDGVVLEDEVYGSTKETLENEIKHIRSLVAKAKGEQK